MRELELRRAIKRKKPDFIRQDAHKKKRLGIKWRRPKGVHSKIRHGFKGYRKAVSIGYGSPAIAKGLDRSGLKIKNIYTPKELDKVDAKIEGIMIANSVGAKKRLD